MSVATIDLYEPHEGQLRIHMSQSRFRVVACGRRYGKTFMACNEAIDFAANHPDTLTAWVSPTYRQSKIAFRLIKKALQDLLAHTSETEMRLELPNGAVMMFCSSDNYDSLRGNAIHFLIIDEAADVAEEAWYEVLRPCLSDTRGKALIIGTPKGRNWFFRLYNRGDDPEYADWASFKAATIDNPYVPKEEVEAAKKELPEDTFKQEYEAEFLEESAGVFRGIDACIDGVLEEPKRDHQYIMGWDVAKYQDYSVITVIDAHTMHIVYWERSNQIDYTIQIKRVADVARRYNAHIIQDSTGVGDPILEQLRQLNLSVDGYLFTNASKKTLIETLSVGIQHRYLTFPLLPVLLAELRVMEYTLTPSRMVQYSAPPGAHDDCVISLALAYYGAQKQGVETLDNELADTLNNYIGY